MIREFDFSIDVTRVLNWRHNNAVNLPAMVNNKQNWINTNARDFWTNWIRDVFDLRTANNFGLMVWARILDLPIFVTTPAPDVRSWGFGINNENFRDSNFAGATSGVVPLNTEQLRLALRMRAFQLHTDSSPLQVNAFLKDLFGEQGVAYMRDNKDMTVTYVFNFALDQNLAFVLQNYDILPTAPAVRDSIEINP